MKTSAANRLPKVDAELTGLATFKDFSNQFKTPTNKMNMFNPGYDTMSPHSPYGHKSSKLPSYDQNMHDQQLLKNQEMKFKILERQQQDIKARGGQIDFIHRKPKSLQLSQKTENKMVEETKSREKFKNV